MCPKLRRARSPGLALVPRDDLRLHGHRADDQILDAAGIAPYHGLGFGLELLEEPNVAEGGGLHHLGQAARIGAPALGGDARPVHHHGRGLVEGAHRVLGGAQVDARLAAHRGVDHGKERGRHPHPAHPAEQDGRDEPRDVRHHAAAVADDHHVPIGPGLDHRRQRPLHRGEVLVLFSRIQHHRLARGDPVPGQGGSERLSPEALHVGVGDDEGLGGGQRRHRPARHVRLVPAEADGVAPGAEGDRDRWAGPGFEHGGGHGLHGERVGRRSGRAPPRRRRRGRRAAPGSCRGGRARRRAGGDRGPRSGRRGSVDGRRG